MDVEVFGMAGVPEGAVPGAPPPEGEQRNMCGYRLMLPPIAPYSHRPQPRQSASCSLPASVCNVCTAHWIRCEDRLGIHVDARHHAALSENSPDMPRGLALAFGRHSPKVCPLRKTLNLQVQLGDDAEMMTTYLQRMSRPRRPWQQRPCLQRPCRLPGARCPGRLHKACSCRASRTTCRPPCELHLSSGSHSKIVIDNTCYVRMHRKAQCALLWHIVL